jgi:hypothetical protein
MQAVLSLASSLAQEAANDLMTERDPVMMYRIQGTGNSLLNLVRLITRPPPNIPASTE